MRINNETMFLVGWAVLFTYLYVVNAVSNEIIIVMLGVLILGFLAFARSMKIISMEEAKEIAKKKVMEMQKMGELPQGVISFLQEESLKNVVVQGEHGETIEPNHYDIGVMIEGAGIRISRLVTVSIAGNYIRMTRIPNPTTFKVSKHEKEDYKYIKGKPDHQQKDIEIARREEERRV